ncbi:hypothetical protein CC1G_11215 [Coprinopsis cinerea okayama7|uniref:Uncharacterized protein n=1 Tax=Coprinopsis cinerea (strain Okayama-7 / 130 / ATCC MYA-4618 / FGSC 9003) TaxID=240176 RepID=A8N114_COPC7|nr:hypothetical protein CC1G_11215 [Coprinopsis cinerea okayama7\|eukprot:XP_001828563.2 hypothetical protein CC1G_11215 [Coprinopsis cinerea okayama7\
MSPALCPMDSLRIAVALAALQHKPADQSIASYVLDLRAKFLPPGPTPPTSDRSWRTHALQMETDLKALKAEYEAERIKNFIAGQTAAGAGAGSTVPSQPSQPPSDSPHPPSVAAKRKSKKKKEAVSQASVNDRPMSLESLLPEGEGFHSYPFGIESLLSVVDSCLRVLLVNGTAVHVKDHIAAAMIRSLEAISKELQQVLNVAKPGPNHIRVVELLSRILAHLLPAFLSSVFEPGSEQFSPRVLDEILGLFLRGVALPAISSFLPLSEKVIHSFIQPFDEDSAVDLRYGVLDLLRTAFSYLFDSKRRPYDSSGTTGLSDIFDSLRMSIILEALKELYRILSTGSEIIRQHYGTEWERAADSTHSGKPQNTDKTSTSSSKDRKIAQRTLAVTKLATKDALWFICTTLYSLATPENLGAAADDSWSQDAHQTGDHGVKDYETSSRRMKQAIRDGLLNLVVLCQTAQRRPCRCSTDAHEAGSSRVKSTESSKDCTRVQAAGPGRRTEVMGDDIAVHSVDDVAVGLVDEPAYGMLLGVVERFLVTTL